MATSLPNRVLDIRSVRARVARRALDVEPTLSPIAVVPAVNPFRPLPHTSASGRLVLPPNRVLKFGGSSVGTPDRIREVARIVLAAEARTRTVVVVSAFQGVTNRLLDCARLAERRDAAYRREYDAISARHRSTVDGLFAPRERDRVHAAVDEQLAELRGVLDDIHRVGQSLPAVFDLAASFGERLSALIVAAYLEPRRRARFVDARQFVITDDQFTRANVLTARTNRAIRAFFGAFWRTSESAIPVVTGFIGATVDGRTTTVGRNGSDYTASLLGAALRSSAIEIWTDVDGVLSADPKTVPSAFVLPQITYQQAMEMSYFGAKVLHPAAVAPAVAKSVPILIKNTLNPDAPGTLIRSKVTNGHRSATGVTSMSGLTLFTLEGTNKVGTPGTAERLFRALGSRDVRVMFSSQASSEQTMCVAVNTGDAQAAAEAVNQEFRFELQERLAVIEQKPHQALVALIGDGIKARPEAAWSVFSALGRHNISISAIAQGASKRQIACIVDASEQARALNVIHRGFFDARKPLALAVIGVGRVGGAFLEQLAERRDYLAEQGFDVKVVAIADSKRFAIDAAGIDLSGWRETLAASPHAFDAKTLAARLVALAFPNAALVDCTADAGIVDAYPTFINASLHIITPNKRANVLPWRRYAALVDLLAKRRRHFLYETNVGAGLPVVGTLRDLIESGDRVQKVEGIVSGTLSYLFNTFDGSMPFSALVRSAHAKGITEPDPREDLSGQDVARKLLILARQTGSRMEMQDVQVESLVPTGLSAGAFSPRFFSMLEAHDHEMAARLDAARSHGAVLRYVGTLEGGVARAELKEVAAGHALAGAKGTDNIVAFTTMRYSETPLVVQGPGAGAAVTAMGVFGDVLKLLRYLPR
jgi:bifunctional aspartokinase / homoserine dehydrogenase 1